MSISLSEGSNCRASFFLAGNYLSDIMACALSDYPPLAITATEVFECIVSGGLASPNDVRSILDSLTVGIPHPCGA